MTVTRDTIRNMIDKSKLERRYDSEWVAAVDKLTDDLFKLVAPKFPNRTYTTVDVSDLHRGLAAIQPNECVVSVIPGPYGSRDMIDGSRNSGYRIVIERY